MVNFSDFFVLLNLETRRVRGLFISICLFMTLFSGLALFNGLQFIERQQDNAQHLKQQHQDFVNKQALKTRRREAKLSAQGKALSPDKKIYRNPAWLAEKGPAVVYPTHGLQVLAQGQLLQLPQAFELSWRPWGLLKVLENLQHPLQRWLGRFDWVFVWVYLWPLFVIALGFDLNASDRQAGSLRLSYIQSGHRLQHLSLRLSARLGLAVGIVLALHLALLFYLPPDTWTRWILILGLVVIYTAFWLALCAFLNSRMRSAAQIAALMIGLWLLSVWWVPASVQQGLQALYPMPEEIAMKQSLREAEEIARKNNESLHSEYMDDHPEMQAGQNNRYALRKMSQAQLLEQQLRPLLSTQAQQSQKRQALFQKLAYLSPVSVVEQSLTHLSGSDVKRFNAFQTQLKRFHQEWLDYFKGFILRQQPLASADFARFPAFEFQAPGANRGLLTGSIAYLLGLSALLLFVSVKQERQRPL